MLLKILIITILFLSACKTLNDKVVIEINNAALPKAPPTHTLTYEEFLRSLSNEEFEIYIKNLHEKYNWGHIYPITRSTRDDYT